MTREQVTPDSLAGILRDPALRMELLASMATEQCSDASLSNRVDAAAQACAASPAELEELVDILLAEDGSDTVLRGLVFHPAMTESTLMRLVDAGRVLHSLAHRAWPESLLLRLAREHRQCCQEAVLTLALHTYAPAEVNIERFLSFVREHIDLYWLRESLRVGNAANQLSGDKHAAALKLVEQYEAAHLTQRSG